MLSVDNHLAWMPSTIGSDAGTQKPPPQEIAFSPPDDETKIKELSLFGEDGFSFADLIDVVNPLQHIPLVSTFYRESTGDEIGAAPRVIGSTLFFGPVGLVGALANVFVEGSTGKDIGEHMASWVTSDESIETASLENTTAAPGTAHATPDAEDPVMAWARAESDWARNNLRNQNSSPAKAPPEGASPDRPGRETITVPDATSLLRDHPPAPRKTPFSVEQMAVLTNDARSAAWAYEVAANLRPQG
ncbi:hypothetical protein L2D14_02195 [Thalassospiraceae bacterium LMO-JJ14]|nr:hypothetical protein L2D14_02195 [Thalassospiraceae bacterium LMO-JJ14]